MDYPLKDLVKIKQKRFEQAVKLVEEKKLLLKREMDLLKKIEKERDKAYKHKEDKLNQLRKALDEGERIDKINQKRAYFKIVQEKLKEQQQKVKTQEKNVFAAEKELEKARKILFEKQKDIEKLNIHKKQWEKEIKYLEQQREQEIQDEIGSVKHIIKKKEKK